jgi:hypothetical protein
MFRDTHIEILDGLFQMIDETEGDIQPYEKTISFEDGIEIEITQRVFCDVILAIDDNSYLRINGRLCKVMNIKKYSDYLELWLYECERDAT